MIPLYPFNTTSTRLTPELSGAASKTRNKGLSWLLETGRHFDDAKLAAKTYDALDDLLKLLRKEFRTILGRRGVNMDRLEAKVERKLDFPALYASNTCDNKSKARISHDTEMTAFAFDENCVGSEVTLSGDLLTAKCDTGGTDSRNSQVMGDTVFMTGSESITDTTRSIYWWTFSVKGIPTKETARYGFGVCKPDRSPDSKGRSPWWIVSNKGFFAERHVLQVEPLEEGNRVLFALDMDARVLSYCVARVGINQEPQWGQMYVAFDNLPRELKPFFLMRGLTVTLDSGPTPAALVDAQEVAGAAVADGHPEMRVLVVAQTGEEGIADAQTQTAPEEQALSTLVVENDTDTELPKSASLTPMPSPSGSETA
ncbi:hypothetical protein KIPB_008166 [Kipferlia bialata]|uniref:Uncharacterized protein n=1 Tax=Kipferlia bialata TaxID=797122 RepID=A0A9K3D148_9EUKA|nr:hypothetical protein KIPB_008166 [Kipferlia bialata]|eukprot:g8166.t1